MKVNNAIILAAGNSTRFAPLSYEMPKGLIEVRGEVLIERQIRQLKTAGIEDISIVTGYMHENYEYLTHKYNVRTILNPEYKHKNNISSIWAAREYFKNTYVCCSDNYFVINPFEEDVEEAYYSAIFAPGKTDEWCMETDDCGVIKKVTIGGSNAWYMMGHTFWSEDFSKEFLKILETEYGDPETGNKLWEQVFIEHLDVLKMTIRQYESSDIHEFDSLEDLRRFDNSYIEDTRSIIIKNICKKLNCEEKDLIVTDTVKSKISGAATGFAFTVQENSYTYDYSTKEISELC